MVEAREGVHVCGAAEAAHLGVAAGIHDACEAGHDGCSRAHGAGFLGDVERAVVEAPIVEVGTGLGDGEDFGVRGGVAKCVNAVVGGGEDCAVVVGDDGPYGHLVIAPRLNGLVVGECHEEGVVVDELGGVDFGEGAFAPGAGRGGVGRGPGGLHDLWGGEFTAQVGHDAGGDELGGFREFVAGDFFYESGACAKLVFAGHEDDGLDVGGELAVGVREVELVFEVGEFAQPTHECDCAAFAGERDGKPGEGFDAGVRGVGNGFPGHGEAFIEGEERVLGFVAGGDGENYVIKQPACAPQDINVSKRQRVKGAGVNGDAPWCGMRDCYGRWWAWCHAVSEGGERWDGLCARASFLAWEWDGARIKLFRCVLSS